MKKLYFIIIFLLCSVAAMAQPGRVVPPTLAAIPDWVTGDTHDSLKYVVHNGIVWKSLISSNTSEPGLDNNWVDTEEVFSNTAWVTTTGNDVQGAIGRPHEPFATPWAAHAKAATDATGQRIEYNLGNSDYTYTGVYDVAQSQALHHQNNTSEQIISGSGVITYSDVSSSRQSIIADGEGLSFPANSNGPINVTVDMPNGEWILDNVGAVGHSVLVSDENSRFKMDLRKFTNSLSGGNRWHVFNLGAKSVEINLDTLITSGEVVLLNWIGTTPTGYATALQDRHHVANFDYVEVLAGGYANTLGQFRYQPGGVAGQVSDDDSEYYLNVRKFVSNATTSTAFLRYYPNNLKPTNIVFDANFGEVEMAVGNSISLITMRSDSVTTDSDLRFSFDRLTVPSGRFFYSQTNSDVFNCDNTDVSIDGGIIDMGAGGEIELNLMSFSNGSTFSASVGNYIASTDVFDFTNATFSADSEIKISGRYQTNGANNLLILDDIPAGTNVVLTDVDFINDGTVAAITSSIPRTVIIRGCYYTNSTITDPDITLVYETDCVPSSGTRGAYDLAYIDAATGSDTEGIVGDVAKPYQTWDAATAATGVEDVWINGDVTTTTQLAGSRNIDFTPGSSMTQTNTTAPFTIGDNENLIIRGKPDIQTQTTDAGFLFFGSSMAFGANTSVVDLELGDVDYNLADLTSYGKNLMGDMVVDKFIFKADRVIGNGNAITGRLTASVSEIDIKEFTWSSNPHNGTQQDAVFIYRPSYPGGLDSSHHVFTMDRYYQPSTAQETKRGPVAFSYAGADRLYTDFSWEGNFGIIEDHQTAPFRAYNSNYAGTEFDVSMSADYTDCNIEFNIQEIKGNFLNNVSDLPNFTNTILTYNIGNATVVDRLFDAHASSTWDADSRVRFNCDNCVGTQQGLVSMHPSTADGVMEFNGRFESTVAGQPPVYSESDFTIYDAQFIVANPATDFAIVADVPITVTVKGCFYTNALTTHSNVTFVYETNCQSNAYTGWADYVDTLYTSVSPFSLVAATKVTLPNNAGIVRDAHKPVDIDSMYTASNQVITGRNGDGLNVLIEFKAKPTTASDTKLTVAIDIGGAVGEIYRRDFIMTKGNGVEHYYLSSFAGYTLDTWETNGGTVKIEADNAADVYDIRYVLTRTHKAR